jgi:hypothetical protein
VFVPITAAGQCRMYAGFPLNGARRRRTCTG